MRRSVGRAHTAMKSEIERRRWRAADQCIHPIFGVDRIIEGLIIKIVCGSGAVVCSLFLLSSLGTACRCQQNSRLMVCSILAAGSHDHALHTHCYRTCPFFDCFYSGLRAGRRRCLKDHLRSIRTLENCGPQFNRRLAKWLL